MPFNIENIKVFCTCKYHKKRQENWKVLLTHHRPNSKDTVFVNCSLNQFFAARRQPLRLGREACFRYIIEVFSLSVCLCVCLSAQMKFNLYRNSLYFHLCGIFPHKWNSIFNFKNMLAEGIELRTSASGTPFASI